MIWSVGATCDINGHAMFSEYFKELSSGKMEGHEPPPAVAKVDCPIPAEGNVYDYLFEHKGRGKWTPWLDLIKDKAISPNVQLLSEIIVPTLDTARYLCTVVVVLLPNHHYPIKSRELQSKIGESPGLSPIVFYFQICNKKMFSSLMLYIGPHTSL